MLKIDLQNVSSIKKIPTKTEFKRWLKPVFKHASKPAEITIRIVDSAEIQALNYQYRHKNQPTNILSFPFAVPSGIDIDLLGDLVICAEILEAETKSQHKSLQAHWAHLTIHGALHLLGYNHESDKDAQVMENLEIEYLHQLGFSDPYS